VAVLDSGIDADHPDLAASLNEGLSASFVPGEGWDARPGKYFHHGTHVSGIIAAADNGLGTVGVAPEAEVVAVKVYSEESGYGSVASLAQGLVYAAGVDADVVNMSVGQLWPERRFCDENGCLSARESAELVGVLRRAARHAERGGATLVASAGNWGLDRDHDRGALVLPADLPGVISVSATAPEGWALNPTTNLDVPASYTNYGRSSIDLAAPGGDGDSGDPARSCTVDGVTAPCPTFDAVLSTVSGGWGFAYGTSMSAPYVSGTAALVIGEHGGSMRPSVLKAVLRSSAEDLGRPGRDEFYGAGRVDAARAVDAAR
jgi:subtilisin family serine protease